MSGNDNGGVVTDVHTTYRVEEANNFKFYVTAHVDYAMDMLAIHGIPMPMTLYFRVDQAEDLIEKIKAGLKKIKEYHFKEDMTNNKGG